MTANSRTVQHTTVADADLVAPAAVSMGTFSLFGQGGVRVVGEAENERPRLVVLDRVSRPSSSFIH